MRDESWSFWELYDRLENKLKENKTLIIAYDIDDTVRPFRSSSCEETIQTIKRCKKILHPIFIVYTANWEIERIIEDLEKLELPYHAINDYPQGTMRYDFWKAKQEKPNIKLYYDIFLDDKSFGLKDACRALNNLCDEVERVGGIKKYLTF